MLGEMVPPSSIPLASCNTLPASRVLEVVPAGKWEEKESSRAAGSGPT
jgi:hypothetical protein